LTLLYFTLPGKGYRTLGQHRLTKLTIVVGLTALTLPILIIVLVRVAYTFTRQFVC